MAGQARVGEGNEWANDFFIYDFEKEAQEPSHGVRKAKWELHDPCWQGLEVDGLGQATLKADTLTYRGRRPIAWVINESDQRLRWSHSKVIDNEEKPLW